MDSGSGLRKGHQKPVLDDNETEITKQWTNSNADFKSNTNFHPNPIFIVA